MGHTDGQLLSYLKALDTYSSTSSPPKSDEMDRVDEMPKVNPIRNPDAPVTVPIDIRSTVKARANHWCESRRADATESRGGLSVEWRGHPPANPEYAGPDDAVLVCSDCGGG